MERKYKQPKYPASPANPTQKKNINERNILRYN